MKILAIRLARLGDVVLLLPALSSLKAAFPNAQLTLLTGSPCASIAALCPAIDEIIAVDRIAMRDGPILFAMREMVRLVRQVRKRHFDLVIDFHSFRETNLLSLVSGAPARVGLKRHQNSYLRFCFNRPPIPEDKEIHVADMFQRMAAAVSGIAASSPVAHPDCSVLISTDLSEWAEQAAPASPRLALYIDAPVPERIWPPERFAELADFAVEKHDAAILLLAGSAGGDRTARVRQASRHADRMTVFVDVTLPQLAALIASSQIFISNDTGPMHLGPAVGVPTLGLFSIGYPEHFRPIGADDRFLRGNPIVMIGVQNVIDEFEMMWTTASRDPRR